MDQGVPARTDGQGLLGRTVTCPPGWRGCERTVRSLTVAQTCIVHWRCRETRRRLRSRSSSIRHGWRLGAVCRSTDRVFNRLVLLSLSEGQRRPVPAIGAGLLEHGGIQAVSHPATASEYGGRAGEGGRLQPQARPGPWSVSSTRTATHTDRSAPFCSINQRVTQHQADGEPVVSTYV